MSKIKTGTPVYVSMISEEKALEGKNLKIYGCEAPFECYNKQIVFHPKNNNISHWPFVVRVPKKEL